MYKSINDAKTELDNSGFLEVFNFDQLDEIVEWMFRNDKSPEDAAYNFDLF